MPPPPPPPQPPSKRSGARSAVPTERGAGDVFGLTLTMAEKALLIGENLGGYRSSLGMF
ncbi:hypothetical protein SMMN14_05778 [Sphaerulina musiva]